MSEKVNLEQLEKAADLENRGPKFGVRHTQVMLACLLLVVAYTSRTSFSLAIVAMTDNSTTANSDVPTYDWTNTSLILSSFLWGYIMLQLVAGHLAKVYGPKWFIIGAMFVNSVAYVLIPYSASRFGSKGVIVCRLVQGMAQGFFFPSTHTLLGKWAPPLERSKLGTIAYSGSPMGTALATPITGYTASSWAGWPATFYLFGGMGFVWCVIYTFLGASSPETHPTISEEEKKYIQVSLGQEKDGDTVLPTPWKDILKSWPFWAVVAANVGNAWGYATLMTEIPTYLNKVLKFNMESNGLLTTAPYVINVIVGISTGPIADYLIINNYSSRTNVRKLFNSAGYFVPALALTCLAFVSSEHTSLAVALLITAMGSTAVCLSGYNLNLVDLSPRFSGILLGTSNGVSQAIAILAPIFVQVVVTDETDVSLWRIVFMLAAGIYVSTAIFFIVFASGKRQWWDSGTTSYEQKKSETEKKIKF